MKVRPVHAAIWAAIALVVPACFAQCEQNGPDTTFGRDSTGSYNPSQGADVASWVRIPRVVGPGTAAEDDGDGGLINATAMEGNGVLDKDAFVKLSGFLQLTPQFFYASSNNGTVPSVRALINFTLNGKPIGTHPFLLFTSLSESVQTSTVSFSECVKVKAEYLRFGGKLVGGRNCVIPGTTTSAKGPTDTTCPGINEIDARITMQIGPTIGGLTTSVYQPMLNLSSWVLNTISVSGSVSQITFRAMSPVIMVHGIRSNSKWFSPYTLSPKGVNAYDGNLAAGHGAWFNQPFDDARVP